MTYGVSRDEEGLVDGGVDGSGSGPRVGGESSVRSVGGGAVTRSGGVDVVAVIDLVSFDFEDEMEGKRRWTYREMSDLMEPAMRRFHASLHSWTISMAYFWFLASPEKANEFSGLPSGTVESVFVNASQTSENQARQTLVDPEGNGCQ